MEALTSYSSKIFAESSSSRAYLSSKTLSNRPQICFFRCQKLVSVDFSPLFPLQFKAIKSLGSSCFSSETQVGWETADDQAQAIELTAGDQAQAIKLTADDQAQETSQSKTVHVHVKFQLQKECMFGQRFLLLGDDPIFGLWDPSDAIPLEWSDGHIWTVELDLPVGKSVQFKFILEGTTGEFVWQPGPDRFVQTWETENTIIVSEDWENADFQKITEEPTNPIMESVATENVPFPNVEEVAKVNERLIVAENISCPKQEPTASASREMIYSEYTTHPKEDLVVSADNSFLVAENISYPKEYMADLEKDFQTAENITYSKNESMLNAKKEFNIAQSTAESNGGLLSSIDVNQGIYQGDPVLVPGLTPLPKMTTQDSSPQLVEEANNTNAPVQVGEADDNSAPEKNQLPEKQEPSEDTHRKERNMMMLNDGPKGDLHADGIEEKPQITKEQDTSSQPINGEDPDANILQNDIQWGRNTLRKFLTSLGIL